MPRWTIGFAVLVLAACGTSGTPKASSPTASAPVDYCERNATYWSTELISSRADSALDYQEMGLSDAEYAIVRDVVTAHRSTAAAGATLTTADTARINALCQARRAKAATSAPADPGRIWPPG